METKTCRTCNQIKDSQLFDRNRRVCKKCRRKTVQDGITATLPDHYIIKILKREAKRKNIPLDISAEKIQEKRKSRLENRKLRSQDVLLAERHERKCRVCNTVKDLRHFKSQKKHNRVCHSCKQSTEKALKLKQGYREELRDCIVKANILGIINKYVDKDSRFKCKDIPQELVDLKRKELLIKRKIQEHAQSDHASSPGKSKSRQSKQKVSTT